MALDLDLIKDESIFELVEYAKNGSINVEQFFEGNKARVSAYKSLIPSKIDITNKEEMDKICESLDKLKSNIEEYSSFLEFIKIFTNFRDEYKDLIPSEDSKETYKGTKEVEENIEKKENELQKLNKKILSGRPGLFEFKNENDLNNLKRKSVFIANELYELYKKYDLEYFKEKVMDILTPTLAISDVLNLYYSYDYFKKIVIQKVYKLEDYKSILEYSKKFDDFAKNPNNLIIKGIPVFRESNIPEIIANKYRLSNISITEEDLYEENLKGLLNKILLILRVNMINNSNITIDELWFIGEVEKIIKKDSVKDISK